MRTMARGRIGGAVVHCRPTPAVWEWDLLCPVASHQSALEAFIVSTVVILPTFTRHYITIVLCKYYPKFSSLLRERLIWPATVTATTSQVVLPSDPSATKSAVPAKPEKPVNTKILTAADFRATTIPGSDAHLSVKWTVHDHACWSVLPATRQPVWVRAATGVLAGVARILAFHLQPSESTQKVHISLFHSISKCMAWTT